MGCDSPLKGYKCRETGGLVFKKEQSFGEKMDVACGSCLGCRLDYSRMWAMRITHEASLYEFGRGNAFVTLTYRDKMEASLEQLENRKYIPDDWSLHPEHMTLFLKRLRKAYPETNIRFFYAGEYGRRCKHGIDVKRVGCPICKVGRPHFHVCLFNFACDDLEAYASDGGVIRKTSKKLEKIWGYGFVDVGELNFASASYTAGYVLKKVRGPVADDHYMNFDMETGEVIYLTPEFVRMSRGNAKYKGQRCGIGAGWYEKYKDDVFPSGMVPVPGKGVVPGVPRYYDEILKEENPARYEEMREVRETYRREHADEYTAERLETKHKCKKARLNMFEKRYL